MGSPEICADDSCGAAEGGFPGNFPGLIDKARDVLVGLNISMEHVVTYGGPSGKVISHECLSNALHLRAPHLFQWIFAFTSRLPHSQVLANGASLLASLASLIIMVGFKVTNA